MLTFQVEPYQNLLNEAQDIFKIHFEELALHKDKIAMGLDHECYLSMEAKGLLHVVTARKDGKLIGYYIGICLDHHPHNKDAGPVATTDMFYIVPSHRHGAGAKLLMMVEKTLRERGVKKASLSTKLHHLTNRALLEALGWEATDLVFHKLLR